MGELDLSEYLADDLLKLTGVVSEKHPRGTSYSIKSLSARDGLLLRKIMRQAGPEPTAVLSASTTAEIEEFCKNDAGETVDMAEKLLGEAYHQMVADGVSDGRVDKITQLVLIQFSAGSEIAQMLVASASGEADAPANRAERRARKTPAKATSRKATAPKTAGLKSSPGSGATKGRGKAAASTPSSTSTRTAARVAPRAKAG
jgi:hypothetical protein